ncbi:LuxR C-terminal-related transcriptional regulator [Streptomyces leeuwenhoekii]|uniref:LuxR C-terminal-related transcriptional regulator n=1 Tax=Streptomyces leeuwenhoekii TaxID=1437453 RepID=UPI00065C9087|nr:LuxR C-terminal-related transcriptional regulator [Streptomyces leeuwenhoekii]
MPRVFDGRLSPGQLAALRLAASGYTSRQIATRLETTEQGIHLRLREAATSLGARSRTHAVVIALARGLLRLDELDLPSTGGVSLQKPADAPLAASQPTSAHPGAPGAERPSQGRTAARGHPAA